MIYWLKIITKMEKTELAAILKIVCGKLARENASRKNNAVW